MFNISKWNKKNLNFRFGQIRVTVVTYILIPTFTLQAVSCQMRPCHSVANRPLPCVPYLSFKMFKISAYGFGTVSMHRGFRASGYEFL